MKGILSFIKALSIYLPVLSGIQCFQHRHPLSQKEHWDIPPWSGSPVYLPQAHLSFWRAFESSLDPCVQTHASHPQVLWIQWKMINNSWSICRCLSFCLWFMHPCITKLLGFLRWASQLAGMSLDLSASQSSMYLSYQRSCERKRCYNSSLTYGQQKQSRRELVLKKEIESLLDCNCWIVPSYAVRTDCTTDKGLKNSITPN